jgi:hypothetical protein
MPYISYEKLPLYIGAINVTGTGVPGTADANNLGVFCEQMQLNYTPNLAPARMLGSFNSADSYILSGPPNTTLSFSAYVGTGEFKPTDFTGDIGSTGSQIRIGHPTSGIFLRNAFLTSYSYTLSPYQPVLVQCDFAIYGPMPVTQSGLLNLYLPSDSSFVTTGKIAGVATSLHDGGADDVIDDLDFASYGHGAYSVFSGNNSRPRANGTSGSSTGVLNDIDVVESIQYQFSCQRVPFYSQIGTGITSNNFFLKEVVYQNAEHSITIQGDNIQKIVPVTGSNPGELNIFVRNASNQTCFQTKINGRLNAENVTIQGGDLARGSITISEILL